MFAHVPTAPADAVVNLVAMFKEDASPMKVNLAVGAYRTAEGKPWILPSIRSAEIALLSDPGSDKEYVPIDGKPEFKRPVQELIFSPEEIDSGRIVTAQALSGAGSLQIIAQFLAAHCKVRKIHLPDPTSSSSAPAIFKRAGITAVDQYPYWHAPTRGLDFEGMMAHLNKAKPGDAVLLYAVAHPTGVGATIKQWSQIVDVCRRKKLVTLLHNAYQGYASGDLANDGLVQRLFADSGLEFFLAQSFAKSFGLYGERIGYIHIKCETKESAAAVLSQLKVLILQAYSSPPRHGAALVNKVLSTPSLKQQWLSELKLMSNRIVEMRKALRAAIEAKGTPGTWNHVTDQIGLFTSTGLTPPQVERMVKEFHIYMTADGRISVAGLNPSNVRYVADCIDMVVRGTPSP